jgi:hypothetical protein
MFGGITFTISSLYLIYWIAGQAFGSLFYNGSGKIYSYFKKKRTPYKMKEGMIEGVTFTEIGSEANG